MSTTIALTNVFFYVENLKHLVCRDPNLWMVKCRIGEEKATVLLLMRKCLTFLTFRNIDEPDEPPQIKSVVAPKGVQSYIYVEVYKQTQVKAAIINFGNVRLRQWKQEMTDVLNVVKAETGLKPKQWVRLRRGQYKDDIAQVDYVDMAQNQVHLKLLPRIDYTRLRGALRTNQPEADSNKRKLKRRPPAKPFDPEAIRYIFVCYCIKIGLI